MRNNKKKKSSKSKINRRDFLKRSSSIVIPVIGIFGLSIVGCDFQDENSDTKKNDPSNCNDSCTASCQGTCS